MQPPFDGQEPGWTQMGTQQQAPQQGIPVPPSRQGGPAGGPGAYFGAQPRQEYDQPYFDQPPRQGEPGQYFGARAGEGYEQQGFMQPPVQGGQTAFGPGGPAQEDGERRQTVRHVMERENAPSGYAPRRRPKKAAIAAVILVMPSCVYITSLRTMTASPE